MTKITDDRIIMGAPLNDAQALADASAWTDRDQAPWYVVATIGNDGLPSYEARRVWDWDRIGGEIDPETDDDGIALTAAYVVAAKRDCASGERFVGLV